MHATASLAFVYRRERRHCSRLSHPRPRGTKPDGTAKTSILFRFARNRGAKGQQEAFGGRLRRSTGSLPLPPITGGTKTLSVHIVLQRDSRIE